MITETKRVNRKKKGKQKKRGKQEVGWVGERKRVIKLVKIELKGQASIAAHL